MKRIGLITSGGDCPGLNPVIRAVLSSARKKNCDVVGLPSGLSGLLNDPADVISFDDSYYERHMLSRGGSRLGGYIKSAYTHFDALDPKTRADRVTASLHEHGIEGIIATGGDGTFGIMSEFLTYANIPFIGIPKTIDNDVPLVDFAVGFQSAVATAARALSNLADTAASHRRVIVAEVMGRDSGYLALYSGIAAGVDAILLPEFSYDERALIQHIHTVYAQKGHVVIAVSESVKQPDEKASSTVTAYGHTRYGGSAEKLAHYIHEASGLDVRHCELGHIQRGGSACAFDCTLAAILGAHAVEAIMCHQENAFINWNGRAVEVIPLSAIKGKIQCVESHLSALKAARLLDIFVGSET